MPSSAVDGLQRTEKARNEHLRRAAIRALGDPIELARAARIVRAGITRGVLRPADLSGPIVRPDGIEDGDFDDVA